MEYIAKCGDGIKTCKMESDDDGADFYLKEEMETGEETKPYADGVYNRKRKEMEKVLDGTLTFEDRQVPDGTLRFEDKQVPDGTLRFEDKQVPDGTLRFEDKQVPDGTLRFEDKQVPDGTLRFEDKQVPDGTLRFENKQVPDGTLRYEDRRTLILESQREGEVNSNENFSRCCGISFRFDTDYKKHCEDTHGNAKPFRCANCRKSYSAKSALIKHFKSKHRADTLPKWRRKKRRVMLCELCNVMFGGWKFFESHALEYHSNVKMMPCSQCPTKFFRRRDVLRHESKTHSVQKEFRCTHCGHVFVRTDELNDHEALCVRRQRKKRKGDIAPDTIKAANFERIRIRCDECREEFASFNALKNHYKFKHPETKLSLRCDYCEKAFSYKGSSEKHLDKRHPDNDFDLELNQKYRRGKLYSCEYCLREFAGIKKYENHGIREHAGLPMFLCKDCGKGFPLRDRLRVHANEAHGHHKKRCSYCPKYYYKMSRWLEHEISCKRIADRWERLEREGVPRYHCVVCDQHLHITNSKSVGNHLKWHREYDHCAICKKGFSRFRNTSGLANHMQTRHQDVMGKRSPETSSAGGEFPVGRKEEFLGDETEIMMEDVEFVVKEEIQRRD